MWTEAILELDRKGNLDGVDDIICKWPELNVPQHSQTTLSTRDAWLKYKSLPGRRAFQFFITLPAPKITFGKDLEDGPMFAELKEAEGSSLYTSFSKPFKLDIDNVYRRDTNEPIRPYLETGMELQTVADRVRGYFAHNEAKSVGNRALAAFLWLDRPARSCQSDQEDYTVAPEERGAGPPWQARYRPHPAARPAPDRRRTASSEPPPAGQALP